MAAPLLAKSPSQELSQELTNILPKGIIKKVIPKKAVILINKEDLELPRNPLTSSHEELPLDLVKQRNRISFYHQRNYS